MGMDNEKAHMSEQIQTLHTHGAIWTDVIRGTTLLLQHLLREKKKASTLIFMPNIKRTLANMKLRYQ